MGLRNPKSSEFHFCAATVFVVYLRHGIAHRVALSIFLQNEFFWGEVQNSPSEKPQNKKWRTSTETFLTLKGEVVRPLVVCKALYVALLCLAV